VFEAGFIHCAMMIGASLKCTVADYCSLRAATASCSLIDNTATLWTDRPAGALYFTETFRVHKSPSAAKHTSIVSWIKY